MTIDVNIITARKEALSKDISDVKGRLIEYDKKKTG